MYIYISLSLSLFLSVCDDDEMWVIFSGKVWDFFQSRKGSFLACRFSSLDQLWAKPHCRWGGSHRGRCGSDPHWILSLRDSDTLKFLKIVTHITHWVYHLQYRMAVYGCIWLSLDQCVCTTPSRACACRVSGVFASMAAIWFQMVWAVQKSYGKDCDGCQMDVGWANQLWTQGYQSHKWILHMKKHWNHLDLLCQISWSLTLISKSQLIPSPSRWI